MIKKYLNALNTVLLVWVTSLPSMAATTDALMASLKDDIPIRQDGEGQYDQLIIRGAYLIDGTGAPATGPVDVVVEQDRITEVRLDRKSVV